VYKYTSNALDTLILTEEQCCQWLLEAALFNVVSQFVWKWNVLYAAIISTLLYSAELWPQQQCCQNNWMLLTTDVQRSTLGVSWKDTNKRGNQVRTRKQYQWKMTALVWSSDMDRSPVHATANIILETSRFQEGTSMAKNKLERHSQGGNIKNGTHLERGGGSNRQEWHQSLAQCVHMDAGWIKVKVKVIWPWRDFSWGSIHARYLTSASKKAQQVYEERFYTLTRWICISISSMAFPLLQYCFMWISKCRFQCSWLCLIRHWRWHCMSAATYFTVRWPLGLC